MNERTYKFMGGSRSFSAQLKTRGPFRAPDGLIFGVAKGLAQHYNISVGLIRLALIVLSLVFFFWPTIILYIAAAIAMGPAPPEALHDPEERETWLQGQLDPENTLEVLSRRGEKVERRLRRLEDYVTSRDYSWRKRLGE